MWGFLPWVLSACLVATITGAAGQANDTVATISDPAGLVNLFIGTTRGGHTFPGTTTSTVHGDRIALS